MTEQLIDLPAGAKFSPDPGSATRLVVVLAGSVTAIGSGSAYGVGQGYTVPQLASDASVAATMPASLMVVSVEPE